MIPEHLLSAQQIFDEGAFITTELQLYLKTNCFLIRSLSHCSISMIRNISLNKISNDYQYPTNHIRLIEAITMDSVNG